MAQLSKRLRKKQGKVGGEREEIEEQKESQRELGTKQREQRLGKIRS